MRRNRRIENISEYHFKDLDALKSRYNGSGIKISDFSIGDPDLPVNNKIIDALIYGLSLKEYNKYPPYEGISELKQAVIKYYEEAYSVNLEEDEILILIGSKEGINNLIPTVCDFGDYAIMTSPSYPVYETCCRLWGVNTNRVPLYEKNMYLPDLNTISKSILEQSGLFIVNYPNNPTGAVATPEFYREIAALCKSKDIVLCNDAAYNEILCNRGKPLSLLQYSGKRNCIEIGSVSKTYNMTGFRIGYAVGDPEIIKILSKVKSNVDSGQFKPIQYAAAEALKLNRDYINSIRKIYIERRTAMEKLLEKNNIKFFRGEGTFYIWCETPAPYSTEEFCSYLLSNYGIIVTPGEVFGKEGKDYFRISLTSDSELELLF